MGFWSFNKQQDLGRYVSPSENIDRFGEWEKGKRVRWLETAQISKGSHKFNEMYLKILAFEEDFNEGYYTEERIEDMRKSYYRVGY